jgi:hypothetical protein
VPDIRVVNSTGSAIPFSADRLAGFLVRLGQPPTEALEIAATVEGELNRARVDEVTTEDLRRVAVDLATSGRTRLAVERALVDVLPIDPASAQPLVPIAIDPPPTAIGPLAHALAVHRHLFRIAGDSDPALGRFATAALAAAEGVAWTSFRDALPALGEVLRRGEVLPPDRLELLQQRALAAIPLVALGQKAFARLPGVLADVVNGPLLGDRPVDDLLGRLHDALGRGMTTARAPAGGDQPPTFPPPPEWRPPGVPTEGLPPGKSFVKVGGFERRVDGPLGQHWPLYCVEREEIDDDLEGMETGYQGAPSDALTTDDWPDLDEVAVDRGWKVDLRAKLPAGGFLALPLGYDVSFHEWRLIENDQAPGIFGRLHKLRDKLAEQREKLEDKAKQAAASGATAAGAAAGAATGIPVPVPDFVSKLAGDLAGQLVDWMIDLTIELLDDVAPFPPLIIAHATTWTGDLQPFSVVMLAEKAAANGPATVKSLAREYPPGTIAESYRHRYEHTARCWWGASQPPGLLPWNLVTGMKRATAGAIAWRAPGTGFGAIVREVNVDDDDAVYVACVRADVLLVDDSELPPPT